MRAAMGNFTEIVELLLENNVKIDKKNTRLFYLSVNNGLLKLFKVLKSQELIIKSIRKKSGFFYIMQQMVGLRKL